MANNYHKVARRAVTLPDGSNLKAEIEAFLSHCRRPALLEPGEDAAVLIPGEYSLEISAKGVILSCWSGERGLQRRITSIKNKKRDELTCSFPRFGGAEGQLHLFDLGHPRAAFRLERGGRRSFLEAFRQMLGRQFPGWEIATLSTEMNLEQSFSPKFPRALLKRGTSVLAAAACASVEDENHFLSFALLWHHRVSGSRREQVPLALFVPQRAGQLSALRLRWLNLQTRIFRFNENGSAGEVDKADLGNFETRLAGSRSLAGSIESPEPPAHRPGPNNVPPSSRRLRQSSTGPKPESWLESILRGQLEVISPAFERSAAHRQVASFVSLDRDMVDLLAVDALGPERGRLAVIELKVKEDIHLPLQALDYWIHVKLHRERGELSAYFPDISLADLPPRLFLVAPAVSFHPANETILSYFPAEIVTERIGLNLEWQQGLKVLFRLKGAEKPQSQRSEL